MAVLLPLFGAWGTAAGATPGPLPLGPVATVDFEDDIAGDGKGGWTDQGRENSLTGFPRGKIALCGVPFEIPDCGPAVIALASPRRPELPQQVELKTPGRRGGFLCVLAGYGWWTAPGSVARIVVNYTDGSEEVLSLDYPQTISSWWMPEHMEKTALAWTGKNLLGVPIGLQLAALQLSQPEKDIRSITVAAVPQRGQVLIAGMSLVDTLPPEAVPQPLWEPEKTDTRAWFPVPAAVDKGSPPVWNPCRMEPDQAGRLMTLSLAAPLCVPDKNMSGQILRTVELLGYNAVELAPLEEVLVSSPDGHRSVTDPAKAEALRAFVELLQSRGIGSVANLGGRRIYESEDGVEAYRDIERNNPAQLFFDKAAEQLLETTVKDFFGTGNKLSLPYANILFEGSLFNFNTDHLSPPHRRLLQAAWCRWLGEKYKSRDALASAWLVEGEPSPLQKNETLENDTIPFLIFSDLLQCRKQDLKRASDQLLFLYEVQQSWFQRVAADMRAAGVSSPLCGTVIGTRPLVRDLQTRLMAGLDVIGEAMNIHNMSLTSGDPRGVFLNQDPLLPMDGDFFEAAFGRVEGKPFVVTEQALAWPDDRSFLHVLGTSVVGALQGWDGITHRGLARLDSPPKMQADDGTIQQSPSLLTLLPLCRNIFLRRDLDVAPVFIRRLLQRPGSPPPRDPVTATESLLARSMPEGAVIAGGVTALLDGETSVDADALAKCVFPDHVVSSTGQVDWNKTAGRLVIQSPRSLAISGELADGTSAALSGKSGYGVLYATSLDGQPLETSRRILIGAAGRSRNKGSTIEKFSFSSADSPQKFRLTETGEPGILMEPVTGTLALKSALTGTWKLTPLNLFGQKTGKDSLSVPASKGTVNVPIDNALWKTPLMLLSNE